ncbi:MAG: permease [Victivallaceae bacterium]|nr:permease [Victivallaceae bacterium]
MLVYFEKFFSSFWTVTCLMAPWLLFGFFAAGVLSVFFSPAYICRHLGKPGFKSIFKAALFGVPLPLCSCGVIPVTVSLKKQGAGRGAAGSFLISTPQTGLDSFFATYSMLGWTFAVFRPAIAFITGIIGGLLMEKFGASREEKDAETAAPVPETQASPFPRGLKIIAGIFHYGFIRLLGNIAAALLTGLALAAFIDLLVPPDFGAAYLKSDWLAMPAMLLFGIPLYVCSTASVPIAAALIVKGISPGAALVFLITGPATNITAITIMTQVLGRKAVIIYLFTVVTAAVGAGVLLNWFGVSLPILEVIRTGGKAELSLIHRFSGAVMLALIAFALAKHYARRRGIGTATRPGDLEIKVSGMTCSHCAAAVTRAVKSVDGVLNLDLDLDSGRLKIWAETPDLLYPVIEQAVIEAGFSCALVRPR